ncbi:MULTISPECIES: ABC transporter permease [unclassified Brevibacterium]|uniref:ABC transporter permease n=1 Tax=unclassified Brevibacterium TaxID=2614124 RepID=UPI001E3B9A91|nr:MULTISPECIES: ABC transporter permease [unclassified Brevibacterium]MCD1286902.1 ABC transporter permease [Brevibacterium sp. CCUG 69071]MDK8433860.1 ABC transporter permease [Brevibacterium sp. H-BE7]
MNVGKYILRRVLLMIPIVLGVATLSFVLMKLAPGDPAAAYLGDKATPEAVAQLRHAWGLDQPMIIQYFQFLGGLFVGDFGRSFIFQTTVLELLKLRMPATLMLMLVSLIFAVVISVPLSLWVAATKSAASAIVSRVFTATVQGMPAFFVGTLLILVLGVNTGLFPVGGYGSSLGEHLYSLVLPGIVVALTICPVLIRSLTAALNDSLSAEYTNFAASKGLSRSKIVRNYAFRNAGITGISILGIQVGHLVGGALVVENVFAIPGVGSLLMEAVLARDYNVVQALTVIFGVLVVLVYLLTDIVYSLVDPRVRLGA